MTHEEHLTQIVLPLNSPHFDINKVAPDLLHAILGIVTEAGELTDSIKRAIFYGKPEPIDPSAIIEELGDLLWYIELACSHIGVTVETVLNANARKLRTRYPGKFTTDAAFNRDLPAEQAALEGGKS